MTIFKALRTICVALVLAAFACSAAPALATELPEMPWWHVNVAGRPSNLQASATTGEVEELTITATKGDALLADPEAHEETFVVPYDATHQEVQAILESPSIYGAGNVQVTGGPEGIVVPGEKVTSRYLVTFKGTLVGRKIGLIETEFSEYACDLYEMDECLEGSTTSAEVTAGEPSGTVVVLVTNLGDGEAHGETSPITVTDKLPQGVEATESELVYDNLYAPHYIGCTGTSEVVCSYGGTLAPYTLLELRIKVTVAPALAPGKLLDQVSVSGGGAQPVSVSDPLTVNNPEKTSFGVESYEIVPENADGSVDTRAGSHPFQLTTTFMLDAGPEIGLEVQPAMPKDLHFVLPAGLVGNPTAFPTCPEAVFDDEDHCPADTQIGVIVLSVGEPNYGTITQPIYNLPPAPGEPARFAFPTGTGPVYLDTAVRTGSDYGVTVNVDNIEQTVQFLGSQTTLWGVPADKRHNSARDEFQSVPINYCLGKTGVSSASCPSDTDTAPFLALPTACEPFESTMAAESWAGPDDNPAALSVPPLPYTLHDQSNRLLPLVGCEGLSFEPSIKVTPDGEAASTPSGLNVDVHVPQASILVPNGVAESDVKDITVALPPGVAVNPSAGDGLQACSLAQIGFTKENPVSGVDEFTPEEASCPNASKIGTVTILTPLLPNPLKGFVYLAAPQSFAGPLGNPFGSVIALYIVAKDPVSGVLVKLPGKVSLNEATGQLTTTFADNPPLPFEDAVLEFFGGERAPLASPAHCGSYTTNASFTPWSGNEAVPASSTFNISSGPNNGAGATPCPGSALPFSPSLRGAATNINAGSFSPFTFTMTRLPGEQNLQSAEVHLPPGLSGVLSNIELCPEPQANEGECPPNSLIGETTVSVGVGGDPYTVTGGRFYLTGPYNGSGACNVSESGCAPFGITFEVPAKAGPFDLANTQKNHPPCDCVLVRGKIEINPLTAQITIVSNPPGTPDAIPTSIEGIPLEIQHVNAITTRNDFQFNPTDCNKMEVTGTIHSSEGSTDTIGVPFQVTNCAALKFAPKFAVSTSGKTSRANGASLAVKLTYPTAPFGSQANIAKVKVELPKQLPSRLTTLQKACTAATFEADPARCPAASVVGHAKAITPLVPVPLEGPAYFVSHGGEAFPSLVIVLQGYGVTIDLVGTTFINKAGITSSTFKTVPDAPVGSFELTLPEGQYSALATNENLCKANLRMPTEFIAQNGAEIHETTKIAVTGCRKAKKAKHKQAHRHKHRHKRKRRKG